MKALRKKAWFIRLTHWEYWPFNVLYIPVFIYWAWLMIKARSAFFFNAANPSIRNGGFLLESKKDIYDLMPSSLYPATLFFRPGVSVSKVLQQMDWRGMRFPVIAKPDIGMRGMLVQKVDSATELENYVRFSKVDFLIQEFVAFENEVGIFYYRYPGQQKGNISGIVGKEFLTLTGDGISTVQELMMQNERFVLQIPAIKETAPTILSHVLKKDEQHLLVPYGNHARGSKFLDFSNLIDEELINRIDAICQQVPGFYYGRLDIRYQSWEKLKQGKNFSIVELNGAGSEPTHIYDPKHSVFFAWKEIIRHLDILFRISRINHHQYGAPYLDFTAGVKMLKENTDYVKTINVNIKQRA